MAKVARRRAEHFATFDAQAAEDEPGGLGTVHSGGNDIRKLGPWSSAVELVEARKAAQELRMERLRQRDSKGGADVGWTPKRDVSLGPRKAPAHVTASAPVSAETTARRFEGAESLEGATDDDRVALADALCRLGRMTREAALLLADGAPGVFAIGNCAALDADSLSAALALCLTPRLDTLSLRFCGRGMTDAAGDVFLRAAGIPVAPRDASGDRTAPESKDEGEAGASATASKLRVREVALAGAYKLSPGGFANVLRATPELRSLSVPQCPRLDDGALAQVRGAHCSWHGAAQGAALAGAATICRDAGTDTHSILSHLAARVGPTPGVPGPVGVRCRHGGWPGICPRVPPRAQEAHARLAAVHRRRIARSARPAPLRAHGPVHCQVRLRVEVQPGMAGGTGSPRYLSAMAAAGVPTGVSFVATPVALQSGDPGVACDRCGAGHASSARVCAEAPRSELQLEHHGRVTGSAGCVLQGEDAVQPMTTTAGQRCDRDQDLGAVCFSQNLESLNLKRCTRLTDDGVATLLACGLPLAVLSLHSVALVGGLTCAAIERFLAQTIRDLDLSWCRGVSEDMCGR